MELVLLSLVLTNIVQFSTAQIGEGDNAGSCFVGPPTFMVYCAVDEESCTSQGYAWYESGYVSDSPNSPGSGCCHCCAGCDLSAETGTNCSEYRFPDGKCGHEGGPSEDSPFFSVPSSASTLVAASFTTLGLVFLIS